MEIGQKVKIREPKQGKVSSAVRERLGQTGIITGFKMVDGSGIGVVVKFDENFATWFFQEEVEVVR